MVYVVGTDDVATPGVKTNTAYIVSDVTEGSDSTGDYSAFTIWDGTDNISVIVRSNVSVSKGDAITFDWDGETELKNVSKLSTVGALTYSNGKQVSINGSGYDLANDVTIINVSTKDTAGVSGNAIATAAQTSVEGVYYNNCWYKVNGDGDIELLIIDITSNRLTGTGDGQFDSNSGVSGVDVLPAGTTSADLSALEDGAYVASVGTKGESGAFASDMEAGANIVFKYTASGSAQTYTLNIANGKYTETSGSYAADTEHCFYVNLDGLNGSGSGDYKTTAFPVGSYSWTITGQTDSNVVASGTFTVSK